MYSLVWIRVVNACTAVCLKACFGGRSFAKFAKRNIAPWLGYSSGIWCMELFIEKDFESRGEANDTFKYWAALAMKLQLTVLLLACVVLCLHRLERNAISATRERLRDSILAIRRLQHEANGCQDAVRRMRKVPFDATSLVDPEDALMKECPICTIAFGVELAIVQTPCDHLFHEECLERWCSSQHVCPLCRSDFRNIDI